MSVYISKRREWEFGIAFGKSQDWIDEVKVWHIRLSLGKRSLVFAVRIKGEK